MPRFAPWALALGAVPVSASDLPEMKGRGTLRVVAQKDEAPEMFRFTGPGDRGGGCARERRLGRPQGRR